MIDVYLLCKYSGMIRLEDMINCHLLYLYIMHSTVKREVQMRIGGHVAFLIPVL